MEQNNKEKPNMPKFNMNWIYITIMVALGILFFTGYGDSTGFFPGKVIAGIYRFPCYRIRERIDHFCVRNENPAH